MMILDLLDILTNLAILSSPFQQGDPNTSPTVQELLSSPVFWFSTVIVGIMVGIVGNLATHGLQRIWARFSESQKRKVEEQSRAFEAEVQSLVQNPAEVNGMKIDRIYILLRATVNLVFLVLLRSFLFYFLSDFLVNIGISVLAVSIVSSTLNRDRYIQNLISEYERRSTKTT